jgi:hypothetical protein
MILNETRGLVAKVAQLILGLTHGRDEEEHDENIVGPCW